jgi:hypothetical protein
MHRGRSRENLTIRQHAGVGVQIEPENRAMWQIREVHVPSIRTEAQTVADSDASQNSRAVWIPAPRSRCYLLLALCFIVFKRRKADSTRFA